MTAAQYNNVQNESSSQNQNNQLTGGSTTLKPEVADTYSFGTVFQPHFIPGFSVSVDYFNIFVANVIQSGVASATTVLNNCAVLDESYYCSLIHRDASGSLGATNGGYIIANNVNAGSLETSGIDVDANYRTSLAALGLAGWGSITAGFQGTFLNTLLSESLPTSGIKSECAGLYGDQCGTPNPKWRHTARLTWTTPWYGVQISGRWRYFGAVDVDVEGKGPLHGSTAGALPELSLAEQNYFDLTVQWKIFDKYQFRVGVNNVLDSKPPVVGSDECPTGPCNGNVYSQVYDIGRYVFVALTATY
jgi:outer membrane receptor protein involved in Fe transport